MTTMLLFDIDGTLLLTGGSGKIAFEIAFQELFGIENAWGGIAPDGKTDPLIIEELAAQTLQRQLTREEYGSLTARYLALLEQELKKAENFRLMPGVAILLQRLAEVEGLVMGLATGNFEAAGRAKLTHAKLAHYFEFGGFGSDARDRVELTRIALARGTDYLAPAPPNTVFVIGDTPRDIAAAQALGLQSIGVATGRYRQDQLRRHQPSYCLADLADVEGFLRIIGVA